MFWSWTCPEGLGTDFGLESFGRELTLKVLVLDVALRLESLLMLTSLAIGHDKNLVAHSRSDPPVLLLPKNITVYRRFHHLSLSPLHSHDCNDMIAPRIPTQRYGPRNFHVVTLTTSDL